jgi:hypothetical protein
MEAAGSSEASVTAYETTQSQTPEDHDINCIAYDGLQAETRVLTTNEQCSL